MLSLIEKSLGHRLVEVVEVLDLCDQDAEEYLTKRTDMSVDLAKHVVNLIGGRLLHLKSAIDVYKNNSTLNEDLIFNSIQCYLFASVVAPVDSMVLDKAPYSTHIIRSIASKGPLFPSELKKLVCTNTIKPSDIQNAINDLVKAKLLRYTSDGKLTWHSKLVANQYTVSML